MCTNLIKSYQNSEYWEELYNMKPHREGGKFSEIYRSETIITDEAGRERNASTAIVYMLKDEEISYFHKMLSDELWHFYDGNTDIIIHIIHEGGKYEKKKLGMGKGTMPFVLVPGKTWFSAELAAKENNFALCSCTVSPGFEYDDFKLGIFKELKNQYPDNEKLLKRLTLK